MQCQTCGHENLDDAHFCASCGSQLTHQAEDRGSWVGQMVGGRFSVIDVLGEGGMGVVYAGEQQMGSTVRRVAIKTLHPHLSKDPSVVARFNRECGTVAQLEHPNTIKVYDFGTGEGGTLYIAMEYVDGESLDKVIERESPLPPARVVNILRQVCGALDEAHDQGVIHRDLKPENVILGEKLGQRDFVKVLDFGIAARTESADAKKEQRLTQQGMVLGTPPYMSPEQFTGAELDRRSDVYSLGIMAYEMLTGRLPFTASTPWQWATEHMTAQPYPIEQVPHGGGIPKQMRDAVMGALSKSPDERPATAGGFLEQLQEGMAGLEDRVSAATEAMQAVPRFAASETPRDSARAPATGPYPTPGAISSTQSIEVPVKKSGARAIVGAIVLLLAAGGAWAAFAGGTAADGGEADADGTGGEAFAAAGPEGETDFEVDARDEGTTDSDGDATDSGEGAPSPSPASTPGPVPIPKPKPPAPKPPVDPKPKPPIDPTPKPEPKPEPEPEPVDCSQCKGLVTAGSWSRAAQVFSKCPGEQASCRAHARRQAVVQARSAEKAGNCSKVRAIAAGAQAMGASSRHVDEALSACK